jgi:hypothetical protein
MSNYTYNNSIGINVNLNSVISYIDSSIVNDKYKNMGISNMGISTGYTSNFTSSITETPSENFGYTINNTDISNYCIAKFVEHDGVNMSNTINIPYWCKKIRFLLLGGGGGGGTSQASQQTQVSAVNVHENINQHTNLHNDQNQNPSRGQGTTDDNTDQMDHHQHNNHEQFNNDTNNNNDTKAYNVDALATSGQDALGGKFLYLTISVPTNNTTNNTSCQVQVGNGNSMSNNTTSSTSNPTVLTIGGTTYNTNTTSGNISTSSISSAMTTYLSTSNTIFNYGKGGVGGSAVSNGVVNNGTNGVGGYYRIYFLTQ